MFCAKCGSKIADEQKFCPSCGAPVADAPASGGVAPVVVVKEKSGGCLKGCLISVVVAAVAFFALLLLIGREALKEEQESSGLSGSASGASVEQASKPDLAEELKLGNQVLAWLKKDDELTDLQKDEEFKNYKGKYIVIKGKVEETGKETFSFGDDFYVALNAGDLNWIEEIHIQFTVAKSAIPEVKALRKGQTVTMRGRMTSRHGMETAFVKLVCDKGEIVPTAMLSEALGKPQ